MQRGFNRVRKGEDLSGDSAGHSAPHPGNEGAPADIQGDEPPAAELYYGESPGGHTPPRIDAPAFARKRSEASLRNMQTHMDTPADRCDGLGFVVSEQDGVSLRTIYPDQLASFKSKTMQPSTLFEDPATISDDPAKNSGLEKIHLDRVDLRSGLEEFLHELNDGFVTEADDSQAKVKRAGLLAGALDRASWSLTSVVSGKSTRETFFTKAAATARARQIMAKHEVAGTARPEVKEFVKNKVRLYSAFENAAKSPCYLIGHNDDAGTYIADRMTGAMLLAMKIENSGMALRVQNEFAQDAQIDLPLATVETEYHSSKDTGDSEPNSTVAYFDFGTSATDPDQVKVLRERIPNLINEICDNFRPRLEMEHVSVANERAGKALSHALANFPYELALLRVEERRNDVQGGSQVDIEARNAKLAEYASLIKTHKHVPEVIREVQAMPHYTRAVLQWLGDKDTPSLRDRMDMAVAVARDTVGSKMDVYARKLSQMDEIWLQPRQPARMATLSEIKQADKLEKLRKAEEQLLSMEP